MLFNVLWHSINFFLTEFTIHVFYYNTQHALYKYKSNKSGVKHAANYGAPKGPLLKKNKKTY